MLRPSYSELMDQLNEDVDLDSKITSRYTIVIAAAKRARQIINGAPCDKTGAKTDKAVSIAVNEMSKGQIKLFPEGIPDDDISPHDSENEFIDIDDELQKSKQSKSSDNKNSNKNNSEKPKIERRNLGGTQILDDFDELDELGELDELDELDDAFDNEQDNDLDGDLDDDLDDDLLDDDFDDKLDTLTDIGALDGLEEINEDLEEYDFDK